MSKVIMITSFKGGVGKSTVSANLAMGLALRGNTVVALDCDIESRCLDIVLGLEDSSLYNICDILNGRCTIDEALVVDSRCPRLSFISAPAYYDFLKEGSEQSLVKYSEVPKLIEMLKQRFDYIILDCPARPDELYKELVKVSTHAVVVSLHTLASIRAAEKTAMMLSDMSDSVPVVTSFGDDFEISETGLQTRLIVNSFKAADVVSGVRPRIYDIISRASTKLLGVIPYDEAMSRAQEDGRLSFQVKNGHIPFCRAIENIAARCDGEDVLLLEGVKTGKNRSKII